jgi:four helix bundle protein
MNYANWQVSVPDSIKNDSLWKMTACRLGLFFSDICWADVTKLAADTRTRGLADQLFRAVGSISANLAEGYSRGTGRDRARFYEYALGSAREARDWYFKARHVLGPVVTDHRLNLLAEIIRLLLTMVPEQRGALLKEEPVPYRVESQPVEWSDESRFEDLLKDIPIPEEGDENVKRKT